MQFIAGCKKESEKISTAMKLEKVFNADTLIIYRGGNSASIAYQKAYSWTLDINVANFFAIRRGEGPAYIVKGEVSKKAVIEYIDENNEQEVIVEPTKVKILDVVHLKGVDFLSEVLPKVASMYHEYKEMLDTLKFFLKSSIHGKEHSARVLLLSLIMSELLGLPMSERKILATAAIYHDTQRTHDWVEPEHGKNSRDYYCSNVRNPDPCVEFLCEYYCLSDEKGYEEIKKNRKLSKNRERTIRLFNIFKDCDGLDRVRLGILEDMDMKQYRMPITKELTLVARICLENVKV